MMRIVSLISQFLVFLVVGAAAQPQIEDISRVFSQGEIKNDEYRNDYFGLTLTPVGAKFTKGSFISPEGKRARLVDAADDAKNWGDKYSIAILADALSANPAIHSPSQYLRSVRHQLEKEGMTTFREETPRKVSSLDFVESVMKVSEQGRTHYQGMYTTFLNGYILSLQVTAPTERRLEEIVRMVKFTTPDDQHQRIHKSKLP